MNLRLRGSGEPDHVFHAIPGVGPILAKRLHETLRVETLEQLEAALHEQKAGVVAGIGPPRLAILRAALAQMLARIRPARTGPSDEPSAKSLLDVDREKPQEGGRQRVVEVLEIEGRKPQVLASSRLDETKGFGVWAVRFPRSFAGAAP